MAWSISNVTRYPGPTTSRRDKKDRSTQVFKPGTSFNSPSPTQKPYTLQDHSAFAFALYLTSVTHPGRTTEEPNWVFSDRSAAHVTQLSGILLPILLRYHMFTSKPDTQRLPVGHLKLHHMLDTDDPTLVDIPELPPLMLDQSFLCRYRPFALSSKPLLVFLSTIFLKHSAGRPWT